LQHYLFGQKQENIKTTVYLEGWPTDGRLKALRLELELHRAAFPGAFTPDPWSSSLGGVCQVVTRERVLPDFQSTLTERSGLEGEEEQWLSGRRRKTIVDIADMLKC